MTNEKLLELVHSRLRERVPNLPPCAICGTLSWAVQDSFVAVPVSEDPISFSGMAKTVLPSAVLLCNNCGNSHFLNLLALGLRPQLDEMAAEGKQPEKRGLLG